jgi:hypothetical protein
MYFGKGRKYSSLRKISEKTLPLRYDQLGRVGMCMTQVSAWTGRYVHDAGISLDGLSAGVQVQAPVLPAATLQQSSLSVIMTDNTKHDRCYASGCVGDVRMRQDNAEEEICAE